MEKIEMYNTMSIYKQKLHEIDEKIIENEKAENQVKKEMLDIARKGISLRKPKYIFHFFVSLALLGLAFISLPVLIGSMVALVANNAIYIVNEKRYNSKKQKIFEEMGSVSSRYVLVFLKKQDLENQKKFVIENIKLFEDFVFGNKVPTSQQEEEMRVSKSLAEQYNSADENNIIDSYGPLFNAGMEL